MRLGVPGGVYVWGMGMRARIQYMGMNHPSFARDIRGIDAEL